MSGSNITPTTDTASSTDVPKQVVTALRQLGSTFLKFDKEVLEYGKRLKATLNGDEEMMTEAMTTETMSISLRNFLSPFISGLSSEIKTVIDVSRVLSDYCPDVANDMVAPFASGQSQEEAFAHRQKVLELEHRAKIAEEQLALMKSAKISGAGVRIKGFSSPASADGGYESEVDPSYERRPKSALKKKSGSATPRARRDYDGDQTCVPGDCDDLPVDSDEDDDAEDEYGPEDDGRPASKKRGGSAKGGSAAKGKKAKGEISKDNKYKLSVIGKFYGETHLPTNKDATTFVARCILSSLRNLGTLISDLDPDTVGKTHFNNPDQLRARFFDCITVLTKERKAFWDAMHIFYEAIPKPTIDPATKAITSEAFPAWVSKNFVVVRSIAMLYLYSIPLSSLDKKFMTSDLYSSTPLPGIMAKYAAFPHPWEIMIEKAGNMGFKTTKIPTPLCFLATYGPLSANTYYKMTRDLQNYAVDLTAPVARIHYSIGSVGAPKTSDTPKRISAPEDEAAFLSSRSPNVRVITLTKGLTGPPDTYYDIIKDNEEVDPSTWMSKLENLGSFYDHKILKAASAKFWAKVVKYKSFEEFLGVFTLPVDVNLVQEFGTDWDKYYTSKDYPKVLEKASANAAKLATAAAAAKLASSSSKPAGKVPVSSSANGASPSLKAAISNSAAASALLRRTPSVIEDSDDGKKAAEVDAGDDDNGDEALKIRKRPRTTDDEGEAEPAPLSPSVPTLDGIFGRPDGEVADSIFAKDESSAPEVTANGGGESETAEEDQQQQQKQAPATPPKRGRKSKRTRFDNNTDTDAGGHTDTGGNHTDAPMAGEEAPEDTGATASTKSVSALAGKYRKKGKN
jgi:hypothetical protein